MSWQTLTDRLDAVAAGAPWRLRRARVAMTLLHPDLRQPWQGAQEGLADITVRDGRIAAVQPAQADAATDAREGDVDLRGRWLLPPFADAHVHLDKTFAAPRLDHTQPSLLGAVRATLQDRARWSAEDLERRAGHAIRLALAHGTTVLRTHVDVRPGEPWTAWDSLQHLRSRWRSELHIEMVAMLPMDSCLRPDFGSVADRIARDGGILGGVTKAIGKPPAAERELVAAALDAMMQGARERELGIDLHVDESGDPSAASLDTVADKALQHGMEGRVTCGHCCSHSVRDADALASTLARSVAAGLSFVTLPTANEYLQDRTPGRTPRWRGIAPVQEMQAAGLPVAVASDNCGDAFYPFGQYDPLDMLRSAIRMAHLEGPPSAWLASITSTPGLLAGATPGAHIAVNGPADFNLFDAMDAYALLSCPPSRRAFVRQGRMAWHAWPEALETPA